ncbi:MULTISPECIES: hypothetical protein [unclassified Streptomyces]|uniref:hypothetical protein n=1 Tax=unclassified Streptomyces TaxID=2593676 RepID=UPI00352C3AFF
MSAYEALPASYARVHPRLRTPGKATVTAGVATGVFYPRRSPSFFRGEVLTKETPALVVED